MFSFFPNNHHAAMNVLSFRAKLINGSDVVVWIEDTDLAFNSPMGVSKIALRNVDKMINHNTAVITRKQLSTNHFEIICYDGCKIVGSPRSPATLRLRGNGVPHARGKIPMWEIEWLERREIGSRG